MKAPSRFGPAPAPGMRNADPRWSDAQPFISDSEYVRKGAEIDDSETGIARTLLGNGDIFYAVDTTSGNRTVTLPDVADAVGQTHIVKRISGGTNACTITSGSGTLDGTSSLTISVLNGVRAFFSDGEVWRVLSQFGAVGGDIDSGTYTPTISLITNAAAAAAIDAQWMRVGNVVNVSGAIWVKATAPGGTEVRLTTPNGTGISFDNTGQAGGGGALASLAPTKPLYILPLVGGNVVRALWDAPTSATITLNFSFQYLPTTTS